MMNRVSIVIPAYNAEDWIEDAIGSALIQTCDKTEVIVVDDKSTDRTAKLVSGYPVRLIRLDNNYGECIASRIGFLHATGDYICRLSADDMYLSPSHISEQLRVMEQTGAAWSYYTLNAVGPAMDQPFELVQSYVMPVPYRFRVPGLHRFDNTILKHPYLSLVLFLLRNPVNSSTLMIRQDIYGRILWSNTDRMDCDGRLLYDLLMGGYTGVAIHDKAGVFYRTHPEQLTNKPGYKEIVQDHRRRAKYQVIDGKYPLWLKLVMRLI